MLGVGVYVFFFTLLVLCLFLLLFLYNFITICLCALYDEHLIKHYFYESQRFFSLFHHAFEMWSSSAAAETAKKRTVNTKPSTETNTHMIHIYVRTSPYTNTAINFDVTI